MKNRLSKFLKIEGLTPSKFAEIMDVQPSNISHIISGRNKPGYEFIGKMLLRFPKINPDWLLLGNGNMYRSTMSDTPADTLFAIDINTTNDQPQQTITPNIELPIDRPIVSKTESIKSTQNFMPLFQDSAKLEVERIVVFYTDQTFKIYQPQK